MKRAPVVTKTAKKRMSLADVRMSGGKGWRIAALAALVIAVIGTVLLFDDAPAYAEGESCTTVCERQAPNDSTGDREPFLKQCMKDCRYILGR